jgi:tetratricopeptide (TPR) repeat protein
MTQGQVSTIVAGDRRVTAIDVVERTLDGLGAPDAARLAFGLAPRDCAGLWPPAVLSSLSRDTGWGGRSELAGDGDVDRRDVLRVGSAAALSALTASTAGRPVRLVEVSRALTSYNAWEPAASVDRSVPEVDTLSASVARATRDYQACRYAVVLDALPALLQTVQSACRMVSGDALSRVRVLAADAYQITCDVMLKLGDVALATLAADRSVEAASRSEDPVALAASASRVVRLLLRGGHFSRAKEIAVSAAQRLSAEVVAGADDAALSVYGGLVLRGAAAAAKAERRQEAMQLLDEASETAARLGRDGNARWTAFGPTNVTQHRVHVAMLLGDAGAAVDLARRIDVTRIEQAERKAGLFIDTAAAYAQWGKYEQTYHALVAAEQVAPEEVRSHREVSRLVGDLVTRGSRDVRSRGREFAQLVGVEL